MKKKEFWEYDDPKGNKAKLKTNAPELSFGSRLIRYLLIFCCVTAAATVIISMFCYFFPLQSASIAQSIQDFTSGIFQEEKKAIPSETPAVNPAETPSDSLVASKKAAASSGSSAPTQQATSQIPDIEYSSEQGNIEAIGKYEEIEESAPSYMVMLDSAMGPMLYYHQADARWADYLYGGRDPMRQYGCGPTAVAMLIYSFTNSPVTPKDIADWASENGCYAASSGSYHSIVMKSLSAYGLQVESAAGADLEAASELLRSGHVLVALMGKGTFTNSGHFIIITNILENGNVHIADCNSYENTMMEWELEQILSELKHSRDSGSPLWAVSYSEEQLNEWSQME